MFSKHPPHSDPHANGNNATHARLLKRLQSLQNSVTVTSKNDGRVIKVSSTDPAEVDRVGTYLSAQPALNLTGGGACPVEYGDLYVNFQCDTHTNNYNDPNWLTQILVNACDLNTTTLTPVEIETLDHFCNDAPNALLASEQTDRMLRIYFGGSMLLLLLLCCCAFILGRRNMANREDTGFYHDTRGSYRPLTAINPELMAIVRASMEEKKAEEKEAKEAEEKHALISRQMNGIM
jgi:hypothetical protein